MRTVRAMSDEYGTNGPKGYLRPLAARGPLLLADPRALSALLDSLDQGLGVLDETYSLLYCNQAMQRLLGLATPSALEQKLYRLVANGHRHWLRHGRSGDWEENFLVASGPVKARLSALPEELADVLAG